MRPHSAWSLSGSCLSSPCCGSEPPREQRASYEHHPDIGRDASHLGLHTCIAQQSPNLSAALVARRCTHGSRTADDLPVVLDGGLRSEERRVGKECRSGWEAMACA